MSLDVMTPYHERWEEFVVRVTEALAGPAALATGDGLTIERAAMGACNSQHAGREPFESSRAVLANMGMDVDGSIARFRANADGCDCEVLMNAADRVEAEEDEDA